VVWQGSRGARLAGVSNIRQQGRAKEGGQGGDRTCRGPAGQHADDLPEVLHPEVLQAHAEGQLLLEIKQRVEEELRDELSGLRPEEAAVLVFLQRRL
jgi:hypothetical protein